MAVRFKSCDWLKKTGFTCLLIFHQSCLNFFPLSSLYGFCKEVFLDKKTLERYNKINDFTREERDQELYEIGQSAGYFKTSTSIDELIKTAKEEVQVDSFTENSFEKNLEDRS